ncbi:uncharacterized protein LOC121234044 isoform X2 [Juglans microcarpa x Juglans regia]|uniref:uncharacterized protein LOC121234044 isoform X2 n=1 Tax=Juglans microcarpa x Juglans regia TaxID=2249226 RepID=UPI001B7F5817|nr:uncharacterized protein LOC121234044 isoform X2 [Juglans microcarpa x Juglans regia]
MSPLCRPTMAFSPSLASYRSPPPLRQTKAPYLLPLIFPLPCIRSKAPYLYQSVRAPPPLGYVGPENPYHPVYMMPLYTYPHRYSYHWGNQHPPTMSYPPSSNLERFQETSQHPVQSSTMPDESEERMSIMNDGFVSVMDVDDEFRVRNVF